MPRRPPTGELGRSGSEALRWQQGDLLSPNPDFRIDRMVARVVAPEDCRAGSVVGERLQSHAGSHWRPGAGLRRTRTAWLGPSKRRTPR